MKRFMISMFVCVFIVGIVGLVHADPILRTENGHYYELVEADGITWNVARATAEARIHLGTNGHLATITDSFEQDFIVQNFLPGETTNGCGVYLLGGIQSASGSEPDGGWKWITGEPWGYTNWSVATTTNPDDGAGSNQDVLGIYGIPAVGLEYTYWDDIWAGSMSTGHTGGYIVEYEYDAVPAPVPEPATMLLLGSGLVGLVGARRKLKK